MYTHTYIYIYVYTYLFIYVEDLFIARSVGVKLVALTLEVHVPRSAPAAPTEGPPEDEPMGENQSPAPETKGGLGCRV